MKLAQWMALNGVDDDTVAKQLGTDRSTISRIRRLKQRPSIDLAQAIFRMTAGDVGGDLSDFLEEPAEPGEKADAA